LFPLVAKMRRLRSYYGGGQRVWPLRHLSCGNAELASPHLIAPVIREEVPIDARRASTTQPAQTRVAQERDASGGIGDQLLERIDWLHPAASIDGSYRAKKATAPAVIRGLRATT
jgi:hypothetical protein